MAEERETMEEREPYCPMFKVLNVLPILFPPEARRHYKNANKEMLLGIRTMLDKAIEELEKEPPKRKVTKIPVK